MRKIFLLLGLLINACNSVHKYDTEFKNPIFNQPLEPLPKDLGHVYLTPTSIDIKEPNNKNKTYKNGNCHLIENEENFIKLLCHVSWSRNEEIIETSKYVLKTTDNADMKKFAEQDLNRYSGNYYEDEYYTYTIKGPFLDNCVDIEENIYEIKGEYIGKVSSAHFCTPPLNN